MNVIRPTRNASFRPSSDSSADEESSDARGTAGGTTEGAVTGLQEASRAGTERNPAWWSSGDGLEASGLRAGETTIESAGLATPGHWQAGQPVTRTLIDSLFQAIDLVTGPAGADTRNSLTLLLNNGLAYRDLSSPPSELRLPPEDRVEWEEGSRWTTWRTDESGRPELAVGDGDWQPVQGHRVRPADPSPEALAGTYARSRAITFAGLVVTSDESVTLGRGGRFELSSRSLATGAPSTTTDAVSLVLQRGEAAAGTTVSASASGGPAAGFALDASRREAGDPARQGTYRLLEDGFGIELVRDDGSSDRRLFFQHEDRIFLGDRNFGRQEGADANAQVRPSWGGARSTGTGLGHSSTGILAAVSDSESSAEDDRRRKRITDALAASVDPEDEASEVVDS